MKSIPFRLTRAKVGWLIGAALVLCFVLPASSGAQETHDHAQMDMSGATSSGSSNFFSDFFKVYLPRHHCMFEEQGLIAVHLISDATIALAYYSIPFTLVYFVRRRPDVAFSWVFWLFAMFILACGTTHVMGVLAIWRPYYWIDGAIKLITAGLSIVTAISLWPLVPKALAMPSPAQLETTVRHRTAELADVNAALRQERDEKHELLEREKRAREQADLARIDAERLEAEQASRVKDEFLATLSHELRTPLTAILGWTRMLERSHKADAVVGPPLEVIHRNARAQVHLVDDLLDMNRIVSGKLQLDFKPVKMDDIVAAALESIQPAAQAKRIEIHSPPCEGGASSLMVLGDAARLQQIFWNLLSNAVKFTPSGGKVTVACELVDSRVSVSITDTGEGIAPEFLEHVFDRFRQADATITRRFGGLGLGLSIVRHLCEMHGGRVSVQSDGLGKGSTFTVELPALSVTQLSSSNSSGSPDGGSMSISLKGSRILVIEDEPDARLLIQRLLSDADATVMPASSAAEGMEALHREKPDLIVCDIGMPHEDGYSFIRRVRALAASAGRDTPAVAVTAFARPEDRVNALLAGFQLHVAKPIDENELLVVIASLLRKREPIAQA